MSAFPDSIMEPRELENLPGLVFDADDKTTVFAEDTLDAYAEIIAIETILGLNPQGAYATIKARMEAIEAAIDTGDDNILAILGSTPQGAYASVAARLAAMSTAITTTLPDAINSEASSRSSGDNALDGRLDTLEALITDSGFVSLTLTSAFAAYGGETPACEYRKRWGVVSVQGAVAPTSNTNNTGTSSGDVIATLPAGARPTREQYFVCHGSTRAKWLMRIAPNGQIICCRHTNDGTAYNAAQTSNWLPFSGTFQV